MQEKESLFHHAIYPVLFSPTMYGLHFGWPFPEIPIPTKSSIIIYLYKIVYIAIVIVYIVYVICNQPFNSENACQVKDEDGF